MLYSLSAMTTYGHANLFLKTRWQLMGALEALNGMLSFGLTTAFLFAIIQRVWPVCGEFQFMRQLGSERGCCSVAASDMTEGLRLEEEVRRCVDPA